MNAVQDARDLYQDLILDRSRNPRHAHRPHPTHAHATGDNPMCGDRVEVFVQRDADGSLAQIGYQARGCAISLASADLMAELLRGATPAEAASLDAAFTRMIQTGDDGDPRLASLRALAGVHDYPSRRRCATLPWQALMQALALPEHTP